MRLDRLGSLCTLIAIASIGLGACSSDSGKTVNVTAADFSLKPDVSSVQAGDVNFKVKNTGAFTHEMVVVKMADASDLPTDPNGEVNEDKIPAPERIGEVEDVFPGKSKTLKLSSTPESMCCSATRSTVRKRSTSRRGCTPTSRSRRPPERSAYDVIAAVARSRSSYFNTLPLALSGNVSITCTWRGTLKLAMRSRHQAVISSGSIVCRGVRR